MSAGVYRILDAQDRLLYVGMSLNWANRLVDHSGRPWWQDVASIRVEHFPSVQVARAAEREAIRTERPKYNLQGSEVRELARSDLELVEDDGSGLAGHAEAAAMLGISRARLKQLRSGGRFPIPDWSLAATPLWLRSTINNWNVARASASPPDRGGRSPSLTPQDVERIQQSPSSASTLAAEYGVSYRTIYRARARGRTPIQALREARHGSGNEDEER